MALVRTPRGLWLGGTLGGMVAVSLACGTVGKNSPDANADWLSTEGNPADGGTDTGQVDDTGDTGQAGDTGDTGQVEPQACSEDPPVQWTLVPQDTNAMATPVQARASILEGWRSLDHISIRSYEFLNYYRFAHPHPAAGQLDLRAQLRVHEDGDYRLHLAVVSEAQAAAPRPPLNLVISVDSSGSMGEIDMSLAKSTITAVAGRLAPGDVVSIVSWDDDQEILLDRHTVSMPFDLRVIQAAARLDSGGATDLGHGLLTAYQLAEAAWMPEGLNRVLIISDGNTNLGQTDVRMIREAAGDRGRHGIFLLGVGVGDALDYHDGMIDSITDVGQGPGLFVATTDDVREIIYDRFDELVDVSALDLTVALTLPPGFERVAPAPDPRAGTPAAGTDRQNLAPGRTLVLHQALRSTCPEAVGADASLTATAHWVDPFTAAPREATATWSIDQLLADDTTLLLKSEAVVAYAEALQQLKREANLDLPDSQPLVPARKALDAAIAAEPLDPELAEIDTILRRLELGR